MKPIRLPTLIAAAILFVAQQETRTAFAQDFEPEYIGGYPTEETAAAMFD